MSGTFGDAVVVALDHGLHWGVFDGFEDRPGTLERVLEGEPDGILASVPFLEQYQEVFSEYPSVFKIGTLDIIHDSTLPGHRGANEIHRQAFSLDQAARAGADAVKVCLVYGREDPDVLGDNLEFAARIAAEGRDHDLSVVLEPTLWGPRITDDLDASFIEQAGRIGSELGPDMLKLYYPGSKKTFEPVVANSPCPVYVAGGPKAERDLDVLDMTEGAVAAGSAGPIYGRNVWQHDDPAAMVSALKAIVHDGATAADALDHLD